MAKQKKVSANLLFSGKDLVRLVLPLMIEQFLLMTVGMADTIMVTAAGEAAVSGVSLVDNINTLIIQVFSALSTGGAVVVAQYLGRQEKKQVNLASRQLFYIMAGISFLLTLIALVFRQHILSLIFGHIESTVMDQALVYFLLTASAYPFIGIYNVGAALFRAVGNSKISMYCTLIVNVINIAVNAVLIYGYNMGAAGAGIGTLVSRIVAALIMMVLLTRPGHGKLLQGIWHVTFRKDLIKSILLVGVPNGLENGMFQFGKLLVLNLITTLGTASVAANAIVSSIAGVANVPGISIGLAMITVIGRCIGAGETQQAIYYTKKLVKLSYVCMSVMGIIMFFFAEPLTDLFHLSQASGQIAVEALKICAVGTALIWVLAFTLPNALRVAGDTVYTMLVSQCSMFTCRVALSYVLSCAWGVGLGLSGVWVAMIVDWIVRACFFVRRYRKGKWQQIRVI